jgi:hypothetical protein
VAVKCARSCGEVTVKWPRSSLKFATEAVKEPRKIFGSVGCVRYERADPFAKLSNEFGTVPTRACRPYYHLGAPQLTLCCHLTGQGSTRPFTVSRTLLKPASKRPVCLSLAILTAFAASRFDRQLFSTLIRMDDDEAYEESVRVFQRMPLRIIDAVLGSEPSGEERQFFSIPVFVPREQREQGLVDLSSWEPLEKQVRYLLNVAPIVGSIQLSISVGGTPCGVICDEVTRAGVSDLGGRCASADRDRDSRFCQRDPGEACLRHQLMSRGGRKALHPPRFSA